MKGFVGRLLLAAGIRYFSTKSKIKAKFVQFSVFCDPLLAVFPLGLYQPEGKVTPMTLRNFCSN